MNAVEYWLGEIANRAEGTRQKYKDFLLRFCEFTGKSPDELIQQRQMDLKKEGLKEQRAIESSLKGFLAHLAQMGNSVSTQQVAYASVRSFFEMHYFPLRMRRGDYPSGESLGSRVATVEDILLLVKEASVKFKAVILFLKDTGLRVSDLRNLTYGDVVEGLEKNKKFINLNLITQKNKTSTKTFLGPEAIGALKVYLDQRKRGTRRLKPEKLDANSPLFRAQRAQDISPISRSGLSSNITMRAKKLGINSAFSAHSLRKFFQTQLEAAGINSNWIDQMIGHKLLNSRGSYSRPTCEQLQQAYMKAYKQLRIFKDPNVETRMSTLEEKLKERDRLIESLVTNGSGKTQEIEALQSQVSKLEQTLQEFSESRKKSDNIMDTLFEDQEFQNLIKKKIREIQR